jgi:hypothetical protein
VRKLFLGGEGERQTPRVVEVLLQVILDSSPDVLSKVSSDPESSIRINFRLMEGQHSKKVP